MYFNRKRLFTDLKSHYVSVMMLSCSRLTPPPPSAVKLPVKLLHPARWTTKSTDSVRLSQLFDDDVFYELMCGLLKGILSSLDCRLLHRKATSKV